MLKSGLVAKKKNVILLKSELLNKKKVILLKSDLVAKKTCILSKSEPITKKTKKSNGGGGRAISWKSEPITEQKCHFVEIGVDR